MKYCPYCGADLLEGAVSFCAECGKEIPRRKPKNEAASKNTKNNEKKTSKMSEQPVISDTETMDDGYDGYYDSILPVDEGLQHESFDIVLAKKIAVILAALVVVIIAYVILMFYL